MKNKPGQNANWWVVFGLGLLMGQGVSAESFRVRPYLQHPTADAISLRWLSAVDEPGVVTVQTPDGPRVMRSKPELASTLAYSPFQQEPGAPHPGLPWLHRVRIDQLRPGFRYTYQVQQGQERHGGTFRAAPGPAQAIRFAVCSDSETEPESSTSPPVDWPPSANSNRPAGVTRYVTDQTTGFRENCRLMAERDLDFVLFVGDLVEAGGQQRHWDEYWRHVAGEYGQLASSVPIFPALGNHENYAGQGGGYAAAAAIFAVNKYLTYFELPPNRAAKESHRGRYYSFVYGPVTVITLDSSDGWPHQTAGDTNHALDGSDAPYFHPGSEQYRWLEMQLAAAQRQSRFTFVQFHHTMFGSGPHSVPFGQSGFSGQSGIAMRVLLPLLFRYGVDAVFSGHDEMLERSFVSGWETLAEGSTRPHGIHFYDVGIAGDGLRGPSVGFDNPHRAFLAHENAPEVWQGKQLISGGKHYGHLEVTVSRGAEGKWQAELTPAYLFPRMNPAGEVLGWERRMYEDRVTLLSSD